MARGNPQDHAASAIGANDITSGVNDDFQVRYFDSTTTHQAHALPASWAGLYVRIRVTGGTVGTDALHYAFSVRSTAEVDRAVAATAAGASAKVGDVIPTGEFDDVELPTVRADAILYFVRESTATLNVRITLRDEKGAA